MLTEIQLKEAEDQSEFNFYVTQGCMVVPIQTELSKEAAIIIQTQLLETIYGNSYQGAVIDLSGINIIDSGLWDIISDTATMINMLGIKAIITGLSPGVVASIIAVSDDTERIKSVMTIEDALKKLLRVVNKIEQPN
jgi:rsbT antagonist protein RsbS